MSDFFTLQEQSEKVIASIQKNIIDYAIEQLATPLTELSHLLETLLAYLPAKKQRQLVEILEHLNIALENKDYLFLYDLLQYELLPLLAVKPERI